MWTPSFLSALIDLLSNGYGATKTWSGALGKVIKTFLFMIVKFVGNGFGFVTGRSGFDAFLGGIGGAGDC
jgi:hypothetical protein